MITHLPDIRPKTGILLEYLQIDKENSSSSFVTVSPVLQILLERYAYSEIGGTFILI